MKRPTQVMIRLSDPEAARLDELRGARSRAAYMRALLERPPREDEIASHREALAVLSGLARGGSVGAAVALERALREDPAEPEDELERLLRGE